MLLADSRLDDYDYMTRMLGEARVTQIGKALAESNDENDFDVGEAWKWLTEALDETDESYTAVLIPHVGTEKISVSVMGVISSRDPWKTIREAMAARGGNAEVQTNVELDLLRRIEQQLRAADSKDRESYDSTEVEHLLGRLDVLRAERAAERAPAIVAQVDRYKTMCGGLEVLRAGRPP